MSNKKTDTHVRFVLCEGLHDVFVMRKTIEVLAAFRSAKHELGGFPYPFGEFIKRRQERLLLSIKSDQTKVKSKPDFSLAMKAPEQDLTLAFFTAEGGIDNHDCKEWLEEIRTSFRPRRFGKMSDVRRVESHSIAVVLDADADANNAVEKARNWWGNEQPIPGEYVRDDLGMIGLWIWPDGVGRIAGTLEDILGGLEEGDEAERFRSIRQLLDTHAPTTCKYNLPAEDIVMRSKQAKARMGVRAQWDHPGASWAVWLRDTGLSQSFVENCPRLRELGTWLIRR